MADSIRISRDQLAKIAGGNHELVRAFERLFATADASLPGQISELATLVGNLSDALDGLQAAGVANTPAGNIAATTVQAALNELDTEKAKKNGDPAQDFAAKSLNGGALAGMRNRLINGSLSINQLGVSGAVTLAAGAYGHDGWKAGAGGCTYTFASNGCDTTLTITAGSLIQIVEGLNVEGGIYTLSQTGTAQARIGINGAAPAGAYAATPITSASATTGQAISVEFGTGTLTRPQLEPGSAPTLFERRPYGSELLLCQRYFQWLGACLGRWQSTSATLSFYYALPVPMRAAPTATFSGAMNIEEFNVAFRAVSGITGIGSNATSLVGSFSTAAATAGNSGGIPASGPAGGVALYARL